MKANMGNIDRAVRIIIAAILLALYFTHNVTGGLGVISLIVAGVFLLTSVVRICPLYTIVGISSCKVKS